MCCKNASHSGRYSVPFMLEQRVHKSKDHVYLVHQCVLRSCQTHDRDTTSSGNYIHPLGLAIYIHLCGQPGKSSQKSLCLESIDSGSKCHFKAGQMSSFVKCHPEAFSLSPSPACYLIKIVIQDLRVLKNQRDSITLLSHGPMLKPLNPGSSSVSGSPWNQDFDSLIFIPQTSLVASIHVTLAFSKLLLWFA